MTYTIHGVADIDYASLFATLKTLQPLYRSEWGVDYWDTDRDEKEINIKQKYSEQSVSYYQYADDVLLDFVPADVIKKFSIDITN